MRHFDRLHPLVQRKLSDMGWQELRPIQVRAIELLLAPQPTDCIIASPTASGKTEAAFLPVLSRIADEPYGGVKAIYVGPLKALINDQFRRLEDLCERMEMPVHKWHGDVAAADRKRLLETPSGVLLITPESLEAMFVLRATAIAAMFAKLQYVVIDEVHAFAGSVRGAQLITQLHRIALRSGATPLRVGLSATLGDPEAVKRWLRPHGEPVAYIEAAGASAELRLNVRGFWERKPDPLETELANDAPADEVDDLLGDEAQEPDDGASAMQEVALAITTVGHGKTNLVFANAKSQIEQLGDALGHTFREAGLLDEIVVHHGSLTKDTREAAEASLRDARPTTAVCSNTLEMGINIGEIDTVMQVSAPWSVASLVQRVGRSGRKPGAPRILRGFFIESASDAHTPDLDRLHLDFVRGVAAIELMLVKFVEPTSSGSRHYSTLIQQLLSCCAESGGAMAHALYNRTAASGAFGKVSKADFAELLRCLAKHDLIEQLPDASLVLTPKAERIVSHYSFYAAFRSPEEFAIIHRDRAIGSIPSNLIPALHEFMIFGGKRWRVDEINADKKQVFVVPAAGKRPPRFMSMAPDIHEEVHRKMKRLLLGDGVPAYLDSVAAEIWSEAQQTAKRMAIQRPVEAADESHTLHVWAGSRILRTLHLVLLAAGIEARPESDVAIVIPTKVKAARQSATHLQDWRAVLTAFAENPQPETLAQFAEGHLGARSAGDKFDHFVPQSLWIRSYVADKLDIEGARHIARALLAVDAVALPQSAEGASATIAGTALTATMLAQFLNCDYATALDQAAAVGEISAPFRADEMVALLRELGDNHEARYVEALRARGAVIDLSELDLDAAVLATSAAMATGTAVIVQGALRDGRWTGRPDILLRIAGHSAFGAFGAFGAWRYQVVDTKLSNVPRPAAILQVVLYADLLAAQLSTSVGVNPAATMAVIVSPERQTPTERADAPAQFREHQVVVNEFAAYVRRAKLRLETAVARGHRPFLEKAYPEPVAHCEVCTWYAHCDARRRADDHLSFVANITRLQRAELSRLNVKEVAALAQVALPFSLPVERGSVASYHDAREQARLQIASRQLQMPAFELLPFVACKGLAELPEPSHGDVYLDLEGCALSAFGPREYMFGVATHDGATVRYQNFVAQTPSDEAVAFSACLQAIAARLAKDPRAHIYHYAAYEKTAFLRLAGTYGQTDVVDNLLREQRFVDLFRIVRHAVRAGVESYSLKALEPLYGYQRQEPLEHARLALHHVERELALAGVIPTTAETALMSVARYNEDDCRSTHAMHSWLERLRSQQLARGAAFPRPTTASSEHVEHAVRSIAGLKQRLQDGGARTKSSEQQQGMNLLADLLDWHQREQSAAWQPYFELREMTEAELFDDAAGLANLELIEVVAHDDKRLIERYRFPLQPVQMAPDASLYYPGGMRLGRVVAIDEAACTIEVARRAEPTLPLVTACFAHDVVPTDTQRSSIERTATRLADVVDWQASRSCITELLLAAPPRLAQGTFARLSGESDTDFAVRAACSLDRSVLVVQGPPGTGKTHLGARIICELLRSGKRVGVTANSHDVVRKALVETLAIAKQTGFAARASQLKMTTARESAADGNNDIALLRDYDECFASVRESRTVVGATMFAWARPDAEDILDVLVVDEAGQCSLANVLAGAPSAKQIILLGDPQQLQQPSKASHPRWAEASALEHMLQGCKTVPPERGVFLSQTFRMAPEICHFVSEQFYESRLLSYPQLANQELLGAGGLGGAGLFVKWVPHIGNATASREEAATVVELVATLLRQAHWVDADRRSHRLTAQDILVVAPYNAHVRMLERSLATYGVRCGTVDRFQGQQAPVVIYSMGSSSADEAPRGMAFLYDTHRLNVAVSRAKIVSVLVASPALLTPACSTVEQMRLASALCRYVELATELS